MSAAKFDPSSLDAALRQWRQGDVILGSKLAFSHVANLAQPVSEEAQAAVSALGDQVTGDLTVLESDVEGFIVVTQTCDVVREAAKRPYVEVAPLVVVSEADLAAAKGLLRPNLAYIPALAGQRLVADLDRVMTIEKSVLVALPRQSGMTTDAEVRSFAQALARKRSRFAFPDAFVDLVRALQKRMVNRYGKMSEEGFHVSALSEIRVTATPSWEASNSDIFFWFIKQSEPKDPAWPKWLEEWLKLVVPTERFPRIEGVVTGFANMTALDYTTSEHLDLDQLSAGEDDEA